MPRESATSSADLSIPCSTCLGTGQVKDVSETEDTFTLIPCPFCGGLGRVFRGRGNNKMLQIYNRDQKRKTKASKAFLFSKSLEK